MQCIMHVIVKLMKLAVIYSECIAPARWSWLAGVGLICPGLGDDGINVLMLCTFGRSA